MIFPDREEPQRRPGCTVVAFMCTDGSAKVCMIEFKYMDAGLEIPLYANISDLNEIQYSNNCEEQQGQLQAPLV